MKVLFYYDHDEKILKPQEIVMVLEFRKLNDRRGEKLGTGICVITQDKEGYYMTTLESRTTYQEAGADDGQETEYIFNTIHNYPPSVALRHKFDKYFIHPYTDEIEMLVKTYNLYQQRKAKDYDYKQVPWESMTKTEFTKWKRQSDVNYKPKR